MRWPNCYLRNVKQRTVYNWLETALLPLINHSLPWKKEKSRAEWELTSALAGSETLTEKELMQQNLTQELVRVRRSRLAAGCGVRLSVPRSSSWITVILYLSGLDVWVGKTLLFTPIVWAGTEAAHCGGSRSSGGSRLPLSNYCGDRKVSRRAIPSWERCASRLQQHTHTHIHTLPSHKPVISALGTLSLWWSLYVR